MSKMDVVIYIYENEQNSIDYITNINAEIPNYLPKVLLFSPEDNSVPLVSIQSLASQLHVNLFKELGVKVEGK